MSDDPSTAKALVEVDYLVLGYLRTWTAWHHLRLVAHPSDPDRYAVVIGPDHPLFPPQKASWE
jgi:hypothetical protein